MRACVRVQVQGRVSLLLRNAAGQEKSEICEGQNEDVCWQMTSPKSSVSDIDHAGLDAMADQPLSGFSALGIQDGTAVSCRICEAAGRLTGQDGAMLVLPPIVFLDDGAGVEQILERAEREMLNGVSAMGWSAGQSGRRLVLIAAVAGGVIETVGGRHVIVQRLQARIRGNSQEDAVEDCVRVVVLGDDEVMEAIAIRALFMASSSVTPIGDFNLDHILPAASAHYVELSRIWGGNASMTAPRGHSCQSHERTGQRRAVDGLECAVAWLSAGGAMTPVVSELRAAALVRRAWARSLRAMPSTACIESESLVRTGLELFGQCVDQVISLARLCNAGLAAVPSLRAQEHKCGDTLKLLPFVTQPLLESWPALAKSGTGRDDAHDVLARAESTCLSLIDLCHHHPVAAGVEGSDRSVLRAEAAKANVKALRRPVLPGQGEGKAFGFTECRERAWEMLQEVIELRVQQLQDTGLVIAALDEGLVEWSLRDEAAATSRKWVVDAASPTADGGSLRPCHLDVNEPTAGPNPFLRQNAERVPGLESMYDPRQTLDFSGDVSAEFNERPGVVGAEECWPASHERDELLEDQGSPEWEVKEEEEGEGEFLGAELAERLRELKKRTSVAKLRGRKAEGTEAGSSARRKLSSGKRSFSSLEILHLDEAAVSASQRHGGVDREISQGILAKRRVLSSSFANTWDSTPAHLLCGRPIGDPAVAGREQGECESTLRGLLDFDSGKGQGQEMMRAYGFLPRVTGSYRNLLANIGLGWIAGGRDSN